MSHLLLILGVAAASLALRTYQHPALQKLGAIGIMGTSFLAGYFVSGSWGVGLACAGSWLLLPWLEILTRVRKLRLPAEKKLRHKAPPNSEAFPTLSELTEEIEEEGFEHVEDAGWEWDDYEQFFRLFHKPLERMQAAVCLIEQEDMAFYYVSLSSRAKDGSIWTTWNYPFSYSLKPVPELKINRVRSEYTFLQMYGSHEDFLRRNGVDTAQLAELDPEAIQLEIQKDLRAQITHNIASGVLQRTSEGEVRYSWRGLFFLWFQFLRDLVRLS